MKKRYGSHGLLIGFGFITLIVAFAGTVLLMRLEHNLEVRTSYVDSVCREKAGELNSQMAQVEDLVDVMSDEVLSYIELFGGNYADSDVQQKLSKIYTLVFSSSLEQCDFIQTAYLRFNPEISTPSSGVLIERTESGIVPMTVTPLDQYDASDIAHVGWYYIPIEFGSGMWMELYYNEYLNMNCVSYIVPLFYDGHTIGVLGMDLDGSEFEKYVESIDILDCYTYIVTPNGSIIGDEINEASTSYYISRTRLNNNMTLCMALDKKELYPIRYSRQLNYVVMTLLGLLIAYIYITLQLVFATKLTTNEVGRRRNKMRGILAIGMTLVVIVQGCFIYYNLVFEEQKNAATIKSYNKGNREVLRVTGDYDFMPYSFVNDEGEPAGSDVELIYRVANALDMDVEITLLPWNEAVDATAAGEYDVLLGLDALSNSNPDQIITSRSVTDDSFAIYGKDTISGISDIKGKKVGSIYGLEEVDVYGIQDIAVLYQDYRTEMNALNEGAIDFAIARKNVAEYYIIREKFEGIKQVYDIIESRLYLGVCANRPELAEEIDRKIAIFSDNGILEDIHRTWFGDTSDSHPLVKLIRDNEGFFVLCLILFVIMASALIGMDVRYKMIMLQEDSREDKLTGVYNRRGGEDQIREMIQDGAKGMFCLMDVDKFKSINDTFGHSVGDKVLSEVGRCLKETFRGRDVVMRLGGDEFIMFVSDVTDETGAEKVLGRFFRALSEMYVPELNNRRVMVSIGVTFTRSEGPDYFEDMYNRADAGTYESKKKLGNAYTIIE